MLHIRSFILSGLDLVLLVLVSFSDSGLGFDYTSGVHVHTKSVVCDLTKVLV